jgi:succinate dehydrogenase / fumarate reductase flavoprotein subunit
VTRADQPRDPAHAVWSVALKQRQIYIRYFAIDLIMSDDGVCTGVVCWKLDDGTMHVQRQDGFVLATGGWHYFSLTSAHTASDGGG